MHNFEVRTLAIWLDCYISTVCETIVLSLPHLAKWLCRALDLFSCLESIFEGIKLVVLFV